MAWLMACAGSSTTLRHGGIRDHVACISPDFAHRAKHRPEDFLVGAGWVYRTACVDDTCRAFGLLLNGDDVSYDPARIRVMERGVDYLASLDASSRGVRVRDCVVELREGSWVAELRLADCAEAIVRTATVIGDFDRGSNLAVVRRTDRSPSHYELYDIARGHRLRSLTNAQLYGVDASLKVVGPSLLVSHSPGSARRALDNKAVEVWRADAETQYPTTGSEGSRPTNEPRALHQLVDPTNDLVLAQLAPSELQFMPVEGRRDVFAFFGFNSLLLVDVRTGKGLQVINPLVPGLEPAAPADERSFYVVSSALHPHQAFVFFDQTRDSGGFSFGSVQYVDFGRTISTEYHRTELCR